MNHRAESVIWHMVEGDKNRTSYFFAQPLNAEEFLLQGHTCTSEDVEATEVKRAELNLQLHASYKQYGRKKKSGKSLTSCHTMWREIPASAPSWFYTQRSHKYPE